MYMNTCPSVKKILRAWASPMHTREVSGEMSATFIIWFFGVLIGPIIIIMWPCTGKSTFTRRTLLLATNINFFYWLYQFFLLSKWKINLCSNDWQSWKLRHLRQDKLLKSRRVAPACTVYTASCYSYMLLAHVLVAGKTLAACSQ